MTEKLPISAKNNALDNSESRSGSLLGRGLAEINSQRSFILKVLPIMVKLTTAILKRSVLTNTSSVFEDISKSILNEIRTEFGDAAANAIT